MADPGHVIGLDVGGAHLKAARLDGGGSCLGAWQVPCRLWEGLDRLDGAIDALAGELDGGTRFAITMTGELVDLFPDRASGVRAIVGRLQRRLAGELAWFGLEGGFVGTGEALDRPTSLASANWLASATYLASRTGDALFIDVGSTTTDLVPLVDGYPRVAGRSDAQRLTTGELVYLGLTRTPLMAIAAQAPMDGQWRPVMAEHFATTADLWRILGELDEAQDQHPAADGAAKTVEGSARRLARMVGSDLGHVEPAAWQGLAGWFVGCCVRRIEDAIALLLSGVALPADAPIVAAGTGRALTARVAESTGRAHLAAADLVPSAGASPAAIAACFPAVAVAALRAATTA